MDKAILYAFASFAVHPGPIARAGKADVSITILESGARICNRIAGDA
jgi:hypothetical protein